MRTARLPTELRLNMPMMKREYPNEDKVAKSTSSRMGKALRLWPEQEEAIARSRLWLREG